MIGFLSCNLILHADCYGMVLSFDLFCSDELLRFIRKYLSDSMKGACGKVECVMLRIKCAIMIPSRVHVLLGQPPCSRWT